MTAQEHREQLIRRIGHLEGLIEGVRDYAIWRNGVQYVGCLQRPLREVLEPYKKELARLNEQLQAEGETKP